MPTARDAFARVIEQQDDQARRILGMPAGAALPPSAGANLGTDPSQDCPATPIGVADQGARIH